MKIAVKINERSEMLAYLSGRGVAVREMHAAGRPCWRHFL